jgi:hypothetical protein
MFGAAITLTASPLKGTIYEVVRFRDLVKYSIPSKSEKTMLRVLPVLFLLLPTALSAADKDRGYHKSIKVAAETRLDWIFPLANQSRTKTPKGWLDGYKSTEQAYELFIPASKDSKRGLPLVIFISPGQRSMGVEVLAEGLQVEEHRFRLAVRCG